MNDLNLNEDFLKADELIRENKISEAMKLLESIILEDPNFGKAHNHIGWIYETKLKENKKAENHYLQAMKSDSGYTASYINYAYLLSNQSRFSELKAHLDKSIVLPGINKATIYNEYGIMYEFQGEYKNAINSFKLAIQHSLDAKTIETYEANIKRCKKKAGPLKSIFW